MKTYRVDSDVPRQRLARLIARAYDSADLHLRARIVDCLLRPLGTLSIAGVAAGAFSAFVYRHRSGDVGAAAWQFADFSRQQIVELARFAGEVNPQALQQATDLLAANASALAAFSAAAVLLYSRRQAANARTSPR